MKDYLNEIRKIDDDLNLDLNIDKWWKLYDRLVDWQIKFDEHKDTGINYILNDQSKNCNKEFSFFIEKNYCEWLKSKKRPVLSNDIFKNYVIPHINDNKKVCIIVIDCLRYDHFKVMREYLEPYFNMNINYALSLIPTATVYSRNAIFSGLFPDELIEKYPEQMLDMKRNSSSLNKHEELFLTDQLKKRGSLIKKPIIIKYGMLRRVIGF